MSAAPEEASSPRLYRCGFCGQDFLFLESCISHLTSHAAEQDRSSVTSRLEAAGDQQHRDGAADGSSAAGKCFSVTDSLSATVTTNHKKSDCVPATVTSNHINKLGSQSSVVPSLLNSVNPSSVTLPLAQNGSNGVESGDNEASASADGTQQNHILVQTSEVNGKVPQPSQPESILVRTDTSGAVIVKASSVRSAAMGEGSQVVNDNGEHPTKAKSQPKKLNVRSPLQKNVSSAEIRVVGGKQTDSAVSDHSERPKQANHEMDGVKHSKSSASRDKDRPYACSECPARYRFLSSLSVHKKRHAGSEPYQCKTCKKKFWHPTNLRVHERVHSEERLFSCEVCGHGFNQANDLRIHMRIHTGEMPLKCPVQDCSRAFRDPACLRRHMNKHRGVQPHIACDICPAKFFHPSGLTRHYKRHTGQKDHVCKVCNTAFARGDTLKLHMRIHSGQKPYTCSVCRQSFSDRSYCRRHVAKHDESLKPRILSNLPGKYSIKQEGKEEEEEGMEEEEDNALEEAGKESDQQPQTVQKKRPAVIVPVEIPDPKGSDIPYASIEIEIPESDLVEGDGSEEMVYQYGDMLITISRSAVELAEESASKADGASQEAGNVNMDDISSTAAPNLLSLQQTEHQYSRATESAKVQQKPADMLNSEVTAHSRTEQVISRVNPVTVSTGVAVPQPLSEYNEIITSIMESELAEGKETTFRIIPTPKEKQRSPRVGERRWQCSDCNAAFFHQAELRRHQTKHTGELPYQCTMCGKKVRDPSNLKRHVRTHTGERPYSCHVCGKTFRQAGHLSAHVRIHTGQRPYRCTLCPATFIEANHLRYHQKVHAGIKPYQCPDCGLSFIRNAELKRHSHVHGGEGNLKCHLCPAKFFRSDALRQHLSKKHDQNLPFQCDVCSQSFCRQSLLDRHRVNMKHGTKTRSEATPVSKSDAENNVAADALCELATGRRSATLTAKDSSGRSLSMDSGRTEAVHHSNTASAGSRDCVLTMAHDGDVQATGASSHRGQEWVLVDGPDETVGSHSDEQFVRRILVDGGSVSGGRVVLVQSEGAGGLEGVQPSTPQGAGSVVGVESGVQPSTYHLQSVSMENLLPESDTARTLVVDMTSQPDPPAPLSLGIKEEPRGLCQSSFIIVSGADQVADQIVSSSDHAVSCSEASVFDNDHLVSHHADHIVSQHSDSLVSLHSDHTMLQSSDHTVSHHSDSMVSHPSDPTISHQSDPTVPQQSGHIVSHLCDHTVSPNSDPTVSSNHESTISRHSDLSVSHQSDHTLSHTDLTVSPEGDLIVWHHPQSGTVEQQPGDVLVDCDSAVGVRNGESTNSITQVGQALVIKPGTSDDVGAPLDQTQILSGTPPSQSATDHALASTMQSIVSGVVQLETVPSLEVGVLKPSRGRRGRCAGGVMVRQERGQAAPQPFVAPLRTRSGRERKIKVKYSA